MTPRLYDRIAIGAGVPCIVGLVLMLASLPVSA